MKFAYYYHTSEGVKKSGTISARRRDDAFAELRKKGIRPIKLTVDPEYLKRRRIILSMAAVSLLGVALAMVVLWRVHLTHRQATRYREETKKDFLSFVSLADDMRHHYRYSLKVAGFTKAFDCTQVVDVTRVEPLFLEFQRIRSIMSESRDRFRVFFSNIYERFPASSVNERLDAQKLYGEIMDEIDTDEARVENNECIVMLLDGNRGKWKVQGGKVVFADSKLERDVGFFSVESDETTARWRRDFGALKESNIEQTPDAKSTAK